VLLGVAHGHGRREFAPTMALVGGSVLALGSGS